MDSPALTTDLSTLEKALGNIGSSFEISPTRFQESNSKNQIANPPIKVDSRNGEIQAGANGVASTSSIFVPAFPLENLGDANFRADHGLRYAYVAGAMANGIGSAEGVEAMSRALLP